MQKQYLPTLKRKELTIPTPSFCVKGPSPGFTRSHYRSTVGSGEADFKLVVSMMRVWKHAEAADWISLHWAKDSFGENLALVFRCAAGYVISPFRVHESWSELEECGEGNSTIVSSGTRCVAIAGNFIQGTVVFRAEWHRPENQDGGDVFFDITCDSRSAGKGLFTTWAGAYFTGLHETAIGGMCARMKELCDGTRGLRSLRQRALL